MQQIGNVDIVIDDGGHTMRQQIHTFEEVYPHVNDGGIFLVEDLHTSYWKEYQGGYHTTGTFIEYAKQLIDDMHAWYSKDPKKFKINNYTTSIKAMHIYDSIIVFDKGKVVEPHHKMTGHETIRF